MFEVQMGEQKTAILLHQIYSVYVCVIKTQKPATQRTKEHFATIPTSHHCSF